MKFVPDNWNPREKDILKVMDLHKITRQEVIRQIEGDNEVIGMRGHEFKRHYTDWNRVFVNWFVTANRCNLLKREHKPRVVEEVTEDQLQQDRKDWAEDMRRLKRN